MEEAVTGFICGNPRDHKCNSYGPTVYGGDDVETTTDQSKAGKGYTWGSVTCSICGRTSMENSMWQDDRLGTTVCAHGTPTDRKCPIC